jgi:hypothetical protein
MTHSQLLSMQELKESSDRDGKSQYLRTWITPGFKPLDLGTARHSCGPSPNDGGSC